MKYIFLIFLILDKISKGRILSKYRLKFLIYKSELHLVLPGVIKFFYIISCKLLTFNQSFPVSLTLLLPLESVNGGLGSETTLVREGS